LYVAKKISVPLLANKIPLFHASSSQTSVRAITVTHRPLQQFVDAISNIRIKHVGPMTKCFSLHKIAKGSATVKRHKAAH